MSSYRASLRNKAATRIDALAGLPIDASDLVRIGRNKRFVTHRYSWEREEGNPIGDTVHRVVYQFVKDLATKRGKSIEVYSRSGDVIEIVEPCMTRTHDDLSY